MPRSLFAVVVTALLAGAGCRQDGTLRVTWSFWPNEPASSGCGQHGVDSVVISGVETGGDALRTPTLCPPGIRELSVAPGTWMLQLSMLDAQGGAIVGMDADAPSPTGTAVVTTDVPGELSVQLDPPPACSDGVDNDGDGRVDAQDPDCAISGTE